MDHSKFAEELIRLAKDILGNDDTEKYDTIMEEVAQKVNGSLEKKGTEYILTLPDTEGYRMRVVVDFGLGVGLTAHHEVYYVGNDRDGKFLAFTSLNEQGYFDKLTSDQIDEFSKEAHARYSKLILNARKNPKVVSTPDKLHWDHNPNGKGGDFSLQADWAIKLIEYLAEDAWNRLEPIWMKSKKATLGNFLMDMLVWGKSQGMDFNRSA